MNLHLFLLRCAARRTHAWLSLRLCLSRALIATAEVVLDLSRSVRGTIGNTCHAAGAAVPAAQPAPASADAGPLTVCDLLVIAEKHGASQPLTIRIPGFEITVRQIDDVLEAMIGRPGGEGGPPHHCLDARKLIVIV